MRCLLVFDLPLVITIEPKDLLPQTCQKSLKLDKNEDFMLNIFFLEPIWFEICKSRERIPCYYYSMHKGIFEHGTSMCEKIKNIEHGFRNFANFDAKSRFPNSNSGVFNFFKNGT